jgi:hypothetical protein
MFPASRISRSSLSTDAWSTRQPVCQDGSCAPPVISCLHRGCSQAPTTGTDVGNFVCSIDLQIPSEVSLTLHLCWCIKQTGPRLQHLYASMAWQPCTRPRLALAAHYHCCWGLTRLLELQNGQGLPYVYKGHDDQVTAAAVSVRCSDSERMSTLEPICKVLCFVLFVE